jgi:putative Mg2+ transporter-C (MgtC) family protein
MWYGEATGQGWLQIGELTMAFALSALIGLEREIRHKSAGLRTHTLVGFAAALIMIVSKYGFGDVLEAGKIVVDPSRVAAQIVTGIGFIGGGLIFVRRDNVRGLTTAAIVWLTTAVGMACGAGLLVLALFVTLLHFVVIFAFPYLVARLPRSRWAISPLQVSYEDGRGLLRDILVICTQQGFAVGRVKVGGESRPSNDADTRDLRKSTNGDTQFGDSAEGENPKVDRAARRIVTVALEVQGPKSVVRLAAKIAEVPGVVAVNAGDENVSSDQ